MIHISGLEALTTSYCLTSTTVDDMDPFDDVYTTATTVSTTIAAATPHTIQIDIANRYVDSLSMEQLAEFDQKIQEKEMELAGMTIEFSNEEKTESVMVQKPVEQPKVYKKV